MNLFKCDNCERIKALQLEVTSLKRSLQEWQMNNSIIEQFMWKLREEFSNPDRHLPLNFIKKVVDEIKGLQIK